jgi:hypothetical protein
MRRGFLFYFHYFFIVDKKHGFAYKFPRILGFRREVGMAETMSSFFY